MYALRKCFIHKYLPKNLSFSLFSSFLVGLVQEYSRVTMYNILKLPFKTSVDMQMDVRDMSFFPDESFQSVIDKGKALNHFYSLYKIAYFHLELVIYVLMRLCCCC